MRKFNIGLTFENEISSGIIDYAKKLYKIMDSDVILGTNSVPHVTIGQFSIKDSEAKRIWQRYKAIIFDLPKITFSGITILPSSSGGAWIEISILKNQSLLKLQDDLIKILSPFGNLTNGTGDQYRPHVTLAHTTSGNEFYNFPFEYKTLRLKNLSTELGIGLGTNFEKLSF